MPPTRRSLLLNLARMKCRIPDTATDEHFSVKNMTYSLSKTSPYILSAEKRSSAPRNFLCFQVDSVAGRDKLVCKVKAGINNSLVLRFTGSA
ncbi:hypothetical protein D9613_012001 [Agrocybe pediades]|uniref:Uncharacterized protein n=1 Tax=Agrocybe pediades TaxID=84607 RepID=A0A8H4VHC9_9AGAR|nr:hypothetical protein D9613_012001 [Agrocybe pediades]